MKVTDENMRSGRYIENDSLNYDDESLTITTKGLDLLFVRVLNNNIVINLSNNRFEGPIPNIIGDLTGLRTLNLSHNVLEGIIPASLQHLSVLESLDLSSNKIGGEIPQQLASLTFLAVLNLSHNHLVGCIPIGKQFDTFENSSYQGNDGLRGSPLSRDCGGGDGVPQGTTPVELDREEEEGDSPMISWQAVLMGYEYQGIDNSEDRFILMFCHLIFVPCVLEILRMLILLADFDESRFHHQAGSLTILKIKAAAVISPTKKNSGLEPIFSSI
ncbi:Receptor-like protein 9dc3 [Datura stramonium]|uniref:Receptor-like protein 9dc3 n=1 Tax=Datura stramonium TaxID=4076 RepID=A0ABS8SU19_DATST|nr:Receptor-like protein 9dc3 [Datura stramonium]